MKYFRLNYMYRDAGNYKFRGNISISGRLALWKIEPFLISGEYFIPKMIGLESLVPIERNEDDHELHEIESIIPDEKRDGSVLTSILIDRYRRASKRGWFVA